MAHIRSLAQELVYAMGTGRKKGGRWGGEKRKKAGRKKEGGEREREGRKGQKPF